MPVQESHKSKVVQRWLKQLAETFGHADGSWISFVLGSSVKPLETRQNPSLVGGLEHSSFYVLGIIIPTDFHIFQRGWNHQPVEHFDSLIIVGVWSNDPTSFQNPEPVWTCEYSDHSRRKDCTEFNFKARFWLWENPSHFQRVALDQSDSWLWVKKTWGTTDWKV